MYPQRSVMTCGLATALEPPHFNPRTRVGCDQSLVLYHRAAREFQSTHPRGVRLVFPHNQLTFLVFQSTHPRGVRRRTRVGCDGFWTVAVAAWGVVSLGER